MCVVTDKIKQRRAKLYAALLEMPVNTASDIIRRGELHKEIFSLNFLLFTLEETEATTAKPAKKGKLK